MKIALISLITATLLGFVSHASGHTLDAADLTGIVFATGLVAWTVAQYLRSPCTLAPRCSLVRLPARPVVKPARVNLNRLAA